MSERTAKRTLCQHNRDGNLKNGSPKSMTFIIITTPIVNKTYILFNKKYLLTSISKSIPAQNVQQRHCTL